MASNQPAISVVVATRNRAGLLRHCLDVVARTPVERTRFEVVVVDNASDDGTVGVVERERARGRMDIRLADCPVVGLARARNQGAAEARGEAVVFLDDDGFPARGWLAGFHRALVDERRPVAQGRVLPLFQAPPPLWLTEECFPAYGGVDEGDRPGPLLGDVVGCNMGARAEVFEALGGFREELGLGGTGLGEDTDFGVRARNVGYEPAYAPDALIRHFIPARRTTRAAFLRRCWASGVSQPLMRGYPEPIARMLASLARHSARRIAAGLFAPSPDEQMRQWAKIAEHAGRAAQILRQRRAAS